MFLGESDQESRVAEQLRLPDSSDVEIAVVVPVFRHSVFVADAVDSALAQETQHAFRVVIVNDGCPHDETRRIATVLATAYPDQVDYIRRVNGGLGAARNTGIDYALRRWPSVRALYFLDADNMIEPKALDRAFDTLMSEPSIGWAYPDIAMFGSRQHLLGLPKPLFDPAPPQMQCFGSRQHGQTRGVRFRLPFRRDDASGVRRLGILVAMHRSRLRRSARAFFRSSLPQAPGEHAEPDGARARERHSLHAA